MRRAASSAAGSGAGSANSPKTPWLLLVEDSLSATGSATGTVTASSAASAGVCSSARRVAYSAAHRQDLAASRQSLGPSAKNSPAAARAASLSRRRQACLILSLSRLVMGCSMVACLSG